PRLRHRQRRDRRASRAAARRWHRQPDHRPRRRATPLPRPSADDHMNAPLDLDWSTANQRLLVLEFARLQALLGDEPARADELDRLQVEAEALGARQPAPPAIDVLAQRFGLSPFERDVVLLCAGCEMDGRLAARCAETQGQAAPWPSFGLALAA